MPVGNDVVDLQDPANQPAAVHPRFDQRVFCDDELRLLDGLDPMARHCLRWTLWAARESAYKYIGQREPEAPFRPGEMRTRLIDLRADRVAGRVEWRGFRITVRVDRRADRVHVVALSDIDTRPLCAVQRVGNGAGCVDGASTAVRRLAAGAVARILGLPTTDIRIVAFRRADGSRIPRAMTSGGVLPVALSLSHDGDWIACAVAPSEAPGPRGKTWR